MTKNIKSFSHRLERIDYDNKSRNHQSTDSISYPSRIASKLFPTTAAPRIYVDPSAFTSAACGVHFFPFIHWIDKIWVRRAHGIFISVLSSATAADATNQTNIISLRGQSRRLVLTVCIMYLPIAGADHGGTGAMSPDASSLLKESSFSSLRDAAYLIREPQVDNSFLFWQNP